MGPVPNWNRKAAAIRAVAWVSRMVIQTRSKPFWHGRPHGLAVAQLLADALEDEHVGVDAHADGEDDAGDAGQGEGGARVGHGPEQDQEVGGQGHDRVQAGEPVVDEHEDRDEGHAAAEASTPERIESLAREAPTVSSCRYLQGGGQGARAQDLGQLVGLLGR